MFYYKKLLTLKERYGVTQKELGALINLDSGTYNNYEKEKLLMPTKHLNTICNFFNVSIDYIFEFTDNPKYKNSSNNIDKLSAGQRLKVFRKENNLTQEKLAKILNTGQAVIAKYEKGINLIATPFLYTICKKYNISADYLLGKTNNPKYLK